MVAVGVRVDEPVDWCSHGVGRDGLEHPPREPEVPQRIDQRRLTVTDHQARV
jgi:hypothetical protein